MYLRSSRRGTAFAAVALAAVATMIGVTAADRAQASAVVSDPAALVNPFIGTGSTTGQTGRSGHTNPGPDMPFGMMQWGPDTWPTRVNGGGYWYDDSQILGFSLDRLSGAGCPVYGDVPILPMVGPIPADPSNATGGFSHASETSSAGYYRATTTSPGTGAPVTTQLTTAMRSGIAEFSFPASSQSDLLLKVANSATKPATVDGQIVPKYQKVYGTSAQAVGSSEVVGSVTAGRFCNIADDAHPNYTLHFDIEFSQPFTANGTWTDGLGDPSGLYLTFDTTTNQTVTAKIGISYTSAANAALNLATEIPGWDFTAVRDANVQAWNQVLSRIEIGGGTSSEQTQFYTALYHALMDPHVYSDVNEQYMGMDGQVHTVAGGHAQYADYSGWDIYRSQVQLLAMLAPDRTSDIITSMLNDYSQDGMLPKWAQGNSETYEMSGDPADAIIAGAYAFGAHDFDTGQALADMIAEATQPNNIRPGQSLIDQYGYLPYGLPTSAYGCCGFGNSVSTQLEYDSADYAIAAFAKALGDQSTYTTFATRAQNWQNTFNPATGYAQAKRANGQWNAGFTPGTSTGFVEGTSAAYTPMVPFNLQGLIGARGGTRAWQDYLDSLLVNLDKPGPTNAALTNEPSLIIPWEYDYVGAPWKTQQVMRQIQTELYTDSPGGEPGNDDLGTFSAWLAWSYLGLYPDVPGTGTVVIGSPVFPHAVVHLGNGRQLVIDAPNAASDAPYVQNLLLNGDSWPKTYLTSNQYRNGARLTFDLRTTPNTSWGSGPSAAPPSDDTGEAPAMPYLSSTQISPPAGQSADVTLYARNVTNKPVLATVSSSPPAALAVSADPTTVLLAPGALGQVTLHVAVAPGSPAGSYAVPITLSAPGYTGQGTTMLAISVQGS